MQSKCPEDDRHVASEADRAADALETERLELEAVGEPIVLPDGKRIYPPLLYGEPVDLLACRLLEMDDPAGSTFLRLIGPPGAGKSQIAHAIAHRLWTGRGRNVTERHGVPFYGTASACALRMGSMSRQEPVMALQ